MATVSLIKANADSAIKDHTRTLWIKVGRGAPFVPGNGLMIELRGRNSR